MSEKTLTRADITEAVYEEVGLSRHESAELVEVIMAEIANALVAGNNVKISSFGSFMLRDKAGRVGRNPKTGEEVPIAPRRVLTFRPSQVLKAMINASMHRDR
ncbi:MAG: integration host factor subunit alpha [Alphaproteobacteria bacterium]|nr:MAG: integration host factor subunit alpha [Alphaproteobacteria bacterium]